MVKKILSIIAAGFMAFAFCISSYAMEVDVNNVETVDYPPADFEAEWYKFKDGNYVRRGGTNAFNGEICRTKEETIALEEKIRDYDYVLVNTDDKEISDEDYALLFEGDYCPPRGETVKEVNSLSKTMYRLFVYRPTLEDTLEQLRENGRVNYVTTSELLTSTVAIDYIVWYHNERAYTIINEFNDNVPSWAKAGFIQVISPIDVQITLRDAYLSTYLVFSVKANTPFTAKIASTYYCIDDINAVDLTHEDGKLEVQLGMRFWVDETNTLENPYIVELKPIVDNYNIQPVNISDMPDYSWENRDKFVPVDITEESTEVNPDEMVEPVVEKSNTLLMWIVLVICVVIFVGVIWFIKKDKEKEN